MNVAKGSDQPQDNTTTGRSRATYGGDVEQTTKPIREGKKTSDPFFIPPTNPGPSRSTPFEDGGTGFKPGDGGQQPTPPVAGGDRWTPPANTPTWDSPGPAPAGGVFPGGDTGNGTTVAGGPSRQQRELTGLDKLINSGVNNKPTANDSYALASAAVGGAASPLTAAGLNKLSALGIERSAEGTRLNNFSRFMQTNYNPRYFDAADRIVKSSAFSQADDALRLVFTQDKTALAEMAGKVKDGTMALDDAAKLKLAHLENRVNLLGRGGWSNAGVSGQLLDEAKAATSIGGEGAKLFTAEELALLERRNAAVVENASRVSANPRFQPPGLLKRAVGAAGLTAMSMGTGMADNFLRDSSDMLVDSRKSLGLQNGLIPAALVASPSKMGKLGWVAGALVAGNVIDYGLEKTGLLSPLDHIVPDTFKNTSVIDGLALGTAFMLPARTGPKRALLVGGAWLASNLVVEPLLGFTKPPDMRDLLEDAQGSAKSDNSKRTIGSMNDAYKDYREVADVSIAGEGVVKRDFDRYNTPEFKRARNAGQISQEEALASFRQSAIMTRAMGDARLGKGTKEITEKGSETTVMGGLDLDMGGYALESFLVSKNFLNYAAQQTDIMNGKEAFGRTVEAAKEKEGLNQFGQQIDASIGKIVGQHDLDTAMKRLKHLIDGSDGLMAGHPFADKTLGFDGYKKTFIDDVQRRIAQHASQASESPGKKQLVAKLLRDEALARIAWADLKLDGNTVDGRGVVLLLEGTAQGRTEPVRGASKPKGYDGAREGLVLAARLDPNNPDLPKLLELYNKTLERAKAAEIQQLGSPISNGLNAENGLYQNK